MNVETNSTAEAGPATATTVRPHLGNAHDEASTTLHLIRGATLLFRHLVLDGVRDEVVTISEEHAKTLHEMMDISWNRANAAVEEIEAVWGRVAR